MANIGKDIKMENCKTQKATNANTANNNLIIRTRTSPKILFDTIKILTEHQRAAVREIGLASLLDITVDGIPCKLGFYVVDNLDTKHMKLKVMNGDIPITVASIHRILGVPTGGLDLNAIAPSIGDNDLSKSWKKQFSKERMRPRDVMNVIETSGDYGPNFKLNFIVIIVSTLAECSRVRCCNVGFLSRIRSVDTIKDIDCAKYIYDCLKNSKIGWKRDSLLSFYAGPITYLTLLYVESTVCKQLDVYPHKRAMQKWTLENLRRRQDIEIDEGGLGTAKLKTNESDGDGATSNVRRRDSSCFDLQTKGDLSEEELLRILDKRIEELDFHKWEADVLLEDAIQRYPKSTGFDIIRAKLASMFKNSKWDRASYQEEDVAPTTVHARTPKNQPDKPSSSRMGGLALDMVDATPIQADNITFTGTLSPLSQYWYSPTLHQEVDRVSNQKIGPDSTVNEKVYQSKDKGKQVVSYTPNDRCKVVKRDIMLRVNRSPADICVINQDAGVSNAGPKKGGRSVTFVDFSPPKFDLGFSPTQLEHVPNEEDPKSRAEPTDRKDRYAKRQARLGDKLRSPYVQRAVTFEVTADDKRMQDWVLGGLGGPLEPIFISRMAMMIKREEVQSLANRSVVSSKVIDGWSLVLNNDEVLRNNDSPRRFFFPFVIAMDPVCSDQHRDTKERYEAFMKNIMQFTNGDNELLSMRNLDLVFFPVVDGLSFYTVVFDLRQPSVEVIDTYDQCGSIDEAYEYRTYALHDMI